MCHYRLTRRLAATETATSLDLRAAKDEIRQHRRLFQKVRRTMRPPILADTIHIFICRPR